ncbi:ATP-binding protein [Rhabdobacter roseus]|uniref:ATP-binding protein n=1 Tax=Rhabdobacter roseus TaxID=1655419 RepID=UPI001C86363A
MVLNGSWQLYWNSLRTPTSPPDYHENVPFPTLWSNTTWKGQPLPSQGFATYELTVLMPKSTETLALRVPDVYCAYRLYANGEVIAQNGVPGTSRATTKPYWSTQLSPLPATDTIRLRLQVANFHHSKGGPYKSITVGSLASLRLHKDIDDAFDYFLGGCLFMGGLFFLGLFLFGRSNYYILYFSFFCLFYSYRPFGTRNYALHSLFPDLPWALTLHAEYLSLFLAVTMFVLYTRALYPEDANRTLYYSMAGIGLLFTFITLLTPPTIFTYLINPFLGLLFFYIGSAFYVHVQAVRHRRSGAQYALLSSGCLLIIILVIMLEYFGLFTPSKLVIFLGYLSFFFLQSLILSFRFSTTLKKAKEEAELGLRTKSEFLSTMSHEIRTPLNSVIGMTHLLMKDDPRPDQKKHLDALLFSGNNLLSIVNDILDFNKIEAGKIMFVQEPVSIPDIARHLISSLEAAAHEAGITLTLNLDPSLTQQVLADKTRISQVLSNLVQNAIKFTHEGGVELRIKVEKQDQENSTLHFSVEDTGIGIPAEKQKLIFERFTQIDSSATRGFSGTGLGLAISKRILELQGVTLRVASEVGVGSTFYFTQTFPLAHELPTEKPSPPPVTASEKPLEGVSILVVEDNSMNILVVQNFLKRWGAESEVAKNGQEALDLLDPSRHQLVLMDLHMPVMDGYEATRRLRERGETLPIIALTASMALDVTEKVLAIGINDVVVKPFNPNHLLQVISHYVKPD